MDKRRTSTEHLVTTAFTKRHSYNWSFQIDKINDFAYADKFLSKEECQTIIKIGKSKQLSQGRVNNKSSITPKVRNSSISWLAPDDNLVWLYRRLTDTITSLNNRFFGFDLSGMQEGIQFTHYQEPDGKYEYHIDRSYDYQIRKLSITIQLSNPKDYTGGELELLTGSEPTAMKKEQGKLVIFPSFVLHRVKPVTKGERNSLVIWVAGSQFK